VVRKDPIWVKIGDFGITKRIQSDTSNLRTPIGTREFTAPEVQGLLQDFAETSVYTEAVDLWSLGCVLFYLLTRSLPFPTPLALMKYCNNNNLHASFPGTPLRASEVSENGDKFLRKLLLPQPSERETASLALTDPWFQHHAEPDQTQSEGGGGWTNWIMQDSAEDGQSSDTDKSQIGNGNPPDAQPIEDPSRYVYRAPSI
jgi:serine/threonine protein kinase